ncbi:MAG: metallophosphoesterase [Planctomycetota bacterium]
MKNYYITRRGFLKAGAATLLGGALMSRWGKKAFAAPTRTPFAPVRFGMIADAHLDIKGKNDVKMSAVSVECLRKSVQDLNQEENLAFVVVAGDLVQDGERENFEIVKKELDALTMPYYVLAGNHDFVPVDPARRREGFTYMTIEEFVRFFRGRGYGESGRRYYAREITPGLRLIGLDACLPLEKEKWGGVLPDEQMAWLDKELSDHAESLNLIVMHHNFVPWSADELKGGPKQWFCIDNDEAARALLSRRAGAAPVVISAHRHIGLNMQELCNVNYFVVPSINSYPMRHAVFTISPETISWKTPMVDVPETLHLEARENLLNSRWWRASEFEERSYLNDSKVIALYENSDMILGSRKIRDEG